MPRQRLLKNGVYVKMFIMLAIDIDNLKFAYPAAEGETRLPVLKGIDLKIEKGVFVSLLGANGSGKSTLSRLINGLLLPDEGSVTVLGKNTSDKTEIFEIRKNVGTVFQNPDNQQVASLVEDDVAFGPENVGMSRDKMREAINYALKVTGTDEFRNAEVARLSGGQKQRVAIAGALAIEPQILILDEATSMLDPKGRAEVMAVVEKLNKERGLTVINITHYMDEAVKSDLVCVLADGRIVAEGTPREIFAKKELLKSAGLELPRAAELAEKLRAAGVVLDGEILTKEELVEALCVSLRKI